MTSTNDGKDVKSNLTSGPKGKSYYIELYKSLDGSLNGAGSLSSRADVLCTAWRRVHTLCLHSAPSTHPHLLAWIQRHTARTILQTEWQSPNSTDEHAKLTEALDAFIEECQAAITGRDGVSLPWEGQLCQRAGWFKSTLSNPWGHPVLKVLLDPSAGPRPTTEQILEWLKEETGVVFATRLRQLALSKCDDLALTLLTAVMNRVRAAREDTPDHVVLENTEAPPEPSEPTFESILNAEGGFSDVWDTLTDMELVLLHKSDRNTRLIDLTKLTPLASGYQLVERLMSRLESAPREKRLWKNAKDVAMLATQVMITRCMVLASCTGIVRTVLYWCARALVRVVPQPRLPKATVALAAPASTARHLHTFATAVHAQQSAISNDLKPFVVELYVRAITFGMNELEKLKLSPEYEEKEARSTEQTLASWFLQLGHLLCSSARMKCECTLTAFSLHPSPAMYDRIKAAPTLPPVALDTQEVKKDDTAPTSEFGSWANDSRSQTNFVKTSETLNMKQTQHKANVLSTAILNEGEALGLGAELCQDIIVLLSGPRVKTLSWDMDREALLENCRVYLERTHGGTRALTTELRYLNLDPRHFQHLPEEEDGEDDVYYGIEKGYEHLVELQEPQPEEIWEDALFDPELTETAESSQDEAAPIRKKKNKHAAPVPDSDSDPLSLVAETKRAEKKERPHSKERSKEPKKKHKEKLTNKQQDRRKNEAKEKKKEKKERKKKEKPDKQAEGPMSSLIGLKVTKPGKVTQTQIQHNICATDSDYDSQGKSSLLSEGNEPDVVYDGQFSMNELKLKSPEMQSPDNINKNLYKNNELNIASGQVSTNKLPQSIQKPASLATIYEQPRGPIHALNPNANISTSQDWNKNIQNVREEVKRSITKLIQFRRQKAATEAANATLSPNQNNLLNQGQTVQNHYQSVANQNQSVVNQSQSLLNQSQIVMNQSKNLINESQNVLNQNKNVVNPPAMQGSLQKPLNMAALIGSRVVNHQSLGFAIQKPGQAPDTKNVSPSPSAETSALHPNNSGNGLVSPKDTCSRVQPFHPSYARKLHPKLTPQQKLLNAMNNTAEQSNENDAQTTEESPMTASISHLNSYQEFLKELQKSTNAGLYDPPSETATHVKRKEVKPVSRVTPVIPNVVKTEPKPSPQCAKPVVQQKKVENAPNTFARLSYMHKNKHNEKSKHCENEAKETPLQSSISADLERRIADLRRTKATYLQTKNHYVATRIVNHTTVPTARPKESWRVDLPTKTEPSSSAVGMKSQHPVLSKLLKGKTGVIVTKMCGPNSEQNVQGDKFQTPKPKHTTLSEKDQDDILNLLSQKNVLNRPQQVKAGNASVTKIASQTFTNPSVNLKKPSPATQNKCPLGHATTSAAQEKLTDTKTDIHMHIDGNTFFPIISNSTIKKTTDLIQTKKSHGKSHGKAKVKTPSGDAKKIISKTDKTQKTVIEENKVTKMYVPKPPVAAPKQTEDMQEQEQDWTKVLDALRAQRTTNRGPNALDMVLNKGSFGQPCEKAQDVKSNSASDEKAKKSATNAMIQAATSKPSTSTAPKSHATQPVMKKVDPPKKQSPVVAKTPAPPNPLILYPEVTKQPYPCKIQKQDDPFISGLQNSDYEILEELMDDDLRQEIGELSSDEESYRSVPMAASKAVKINPNTKINSTITNKTVQAKPKPEINTACDFKHRAKAPELSTPPATTFKKPDSKLRIISNEKVDIGKLPETLLASNVTRHLPKAMTPKMQDQQALNHNLVAPSVHVAPSAPQVAPSAHVTTTAQVAPSAHVTPDAHVAPNVHVAVSAPIPQTNLDPNVFYAAQTLVQNVVVYDPFLDLCKISQTFAVVNETANIGLYQPEFIATIPEQVLINTVPTVAVPTVNVTPAANITINITGSNQTAASNVQMQTSNVVPIPTTSTGLAKQTPPVTNVTFPEPSKKVVDMTNEEKPKAKLHKPVNPMTPKQIDKPDSNINKSNERKVLSEVQEKLKMAAPEKTQSVKPKNQKPLECEKKNEVSKDQERVAKKRLALMNREIHHRNCCPAIPLKYIPLSAFKKAEEKPAVVQGNEMNDKDKKASDKFFEKIATIVQKADIKLSENTKENKDTRACVLLLKSDKSQQKDDGTSNDGNRKRRKSKVRLKYTIVNKFDESEDKDSEIAQTEESSLRNLKTEMSIDNDATLKASDETTKMEDNSNSNATKIETPVPTRVSKRILNKKIKKNKEKAEKAKSMQEESNKQPEVNKKGKERKTVDKKTPLTDKPDDDHAEQLDIEEAILGNKIPTAKVHEVTNQQPKRLQDQKSFEKLSFEMNSKTEVINAEKESNSETIEILSSPEVSHLDADPLSKLNITKPDNKVENVITKPKNVLASVLHDTGVKESAVKNNESLSKDGPSRTISEAKDDRKGLKNASVVKTDTVQEKINRNKHGTQNKLLELEDNIESAINAITESTVNSPLMKSPNENDLCEDINTSKKLDDEGVTLEKVSKPIEVMSSDKQHRANKQQCNNNTSKLSQQTSESTKKIEKARPIVSSVITPAPIKGAINKSTDKSELPKSTSDKLPNAKSRAANENITKAMDKVVANSEILQTYKDSIHMEEIFKPEQKDPNTRCFRIKLPNKKVFKATVFGQVHVSIDTLFDDPALKNILMSGMPDKKRYTLSIQQISTMDNRVLDTRINEINVEDGGGKPKEVETVNLISDDEDEPQPKSTSGSGTVNSGPQQTIITGFGTYKIKPIDKETFDKHQRKLSQKCTVNLHRLAEKSKLDTLVNSLLEDLDVLPPQTDLEVIDLDDSSNEVVMPEIQSETKLGELKNLLLQELGVADVGQSVISNVQQENLQPSRACKSQPLDSENKLKGSTHIGKHDDDHKAIIRDCYVKLVNCDYMLKNIENDENNPTEAANDGEAITCDDEDDTPGVLSRSGSFSILNNLEVFDDVLLPTDGKISPVIDIYETKNALQRTTSSGRNSPVMEVFDMIAALQENAIKSAGTFNLSSIEQDLLCESEWFMTKRDLYSQNVDDLAECVFENIHSCANKNDTSTDCDTDITDLSFLDYDNICIETSIVPSLTSIMSKYFEDNPIVNQLTPNTARTTLDITVPVSLKRKLSDQDKSTPKLRKIPDLLISDEIELTKACNTKEQDCLESEFTDSNEADVQHKADLNESNTSISILEELPIFTETSDDISNCPSPSLLTEDVVTQLPDVFEMTKEEQLTVETNENTDTDTILTKLNTHEETFNETMLRTDCDESNTTLKSNISMQDDANNVPNEDTTSEIIFDVSCEKALIDEEPIPTTKTESIEVTSSDGTTTPIEVTNDLPKSDESASNTENLREQDSEAHGKCEAEFITTMDTEVVTLSSIDNGEQSDIHATTEHTTDLLKCEELRNAEPCDQTSEEITETETQSTPSPQNALETVVSDSVNVSVTIKDTNAPLETGSISDNVSVAIEDTDASLETDSVPDKISLAMGDTNTPLETCSVSDNVLVTIEDTNAPHETASVSDNVSVAIEDTDASLETRSDLDKVSVAIEDTNAPLETDSVSDNVLITIEDTNAPHETASVSDNVSVAIEDTDASHETRSDLDKVSVAIEDTSAPLETYSVSDNVLITIEDTNAPLETASVSDNVSVEIEDTDASLETCSDSDNVLITIEDTNAPLETGSVSDNVSVAIEDTDVSPRSDSDKVSVAIEDTNALETDTVSDNVCVAIEDTNASLETGSVSDNVLVTIEDTNAPLETASVSDNVSVAIEDTDVSPRSDSDKVSVAIEDTNALETDTVSDNVSVAIEDTNASLETGSVSDNVLVTIEDTDASRETRTDSDKVSVAIEDADASLETGPVSDNVSATIEDANSSLETDSISDNVSVTIEDANSSPETALVSDNVSVTIEDANAPLETGSVSDNVSATIEDTDAPLETGSISNNVSVTIENANASVKTGSVSDNVSETIEDPNAPLETGLVPENVSVTTDDTNASQICDDNSLKCEELECTTIEPTISETKAVPIRDTADIPECEEPPSIGRSIDPCDSASNKTTLDTRFDANDNENEILNECELPREESESVESDMIEKEEPLNCESMVAASVINTITKDSPVIDQQTVEEKSENNTYAEEDETDINYKNITADEGANDNIDEDPVVLLLKETEFYADIALITTNVDDALVEKSENVDNSNRGVTTASNIGSSTKEINKVEEKHTTLKTGITDVRSETIVVIGDENISNENISNENIDWVENETIIDNELSEKSSNDNSSPSDSYSPEIPLLNEESFNPQPNNLVDEEKKDRCDFTEVTTTVETNNKLIQTDMQDNNNKSSVDFENEIENEVTQEIPTSRQPTCEDNYVCQTDMFVEEVSGSPKLNRNIKKTYCRESGQRTLDRKNYDTDKNTEESKAESVRPLDSCDSNEIVVEKSIREIDGNISLLESNATLVYKDDSGVILKGIEYEDPEIGTCFVFPIVKSSDVTEASELLNESVESTIEVIHKMTRGEMTSEISNVGDQYSAFYDEIELHVLQPKRTYSKRHLKRKSVMRNFNVCNKRPRRNSRVKDYASLVKYPERKYRKGKNIDIPKQTMTSIVGTSYNREFKTVLDYQNTINFSYAISFSHQHIDVPKLITNWPIKGSVSKESQDQIEVSSGLFVDSELSENPLRDPMHLTLVEEITAEYNDAEYTNDCETDKTNCNMGFGEGSGRVIQNLDGGAISKFSAATLSDVKQSQPFLQSKDGGDSGNQENFLESSKRQQIQTMTRFFNYVQLRDKVRSFFKNTANELAYEKEQEKNNHTKNSDESSFPFELCTPEYIQPMPLEAVVQVVQVGQLPVSAAAQNPVTCDPRVTQVSDASPSQCSAGNSPNDDSQPEIKTEYTELTTAEMSLPMVAEYMDHNQTANMESQEPTNLSNEDIPIKTEIVKAEVKIEIEEESDEKETSLENCEQSEMENHVNNVNYLYDTNNTNPPVDAEFQDLFGEKQGTPEPVMELQQQNGSNEKTDQIAHAMNAAGITTSSETVTTSQAQALVNLLSQKMRQGVVTTTPNSANNYPKTTSINTISLQQALAQILPPPLNQTNTTDNSQQGQNQVPPVLHIVQGKNAAGNQITLVDNSQQSVITNPNATPVLHIVQNKAATTGPTSNGGPAPQSNTFSGISLVDAGLQQGGNQLLHIVNTGTQNKNNAGQLLKRVNLLTNLTNVQGSNEQKMVQFVCKSADGKAIQLNAPHQRSMVLRLQPIETPNIQTAPSKPAENQDLSPTLNSTNSVPKEPVTTQQEIKSRSVYEENYAKFIQNSNKSSLLEKSTSLPKFNQAFGKQVYQDGKQNDINSNNSHLSNVNNTENTECQPTDNTINLDHIRQVGSPPLLLRKPTITTQAQPNLVQQIKQTVAPMNIQTMHGGVIYTRQIPVNIGGGQTINLITVPSTELMDESGQKQQVNQGDIEPSIIKIVPQSQPNADGTSDDMNGSGENGQHPPQPQQVLTQMRIKLPMLSKNPHLVAGTRVVRPSFFQIQRNVIAGTNQPVYQQLVLTAAPPLGQQTIRLPQAPPRQVKVPESPSSSESMSSSTLEQLREFDMVLEQVKERSTVQPNSSSSTSTSYKIHTTSTDTTDSAATATSTTTETTQVLYSIGGSQPLNVAYVNRKTTITTPATSSFTRSPDSSGIADSPSSSTHVQIPQTATSEASSSEAVTPQPKPAKVSSKKRHKSSSHSHSSSMKLSSVPPKTSTQKPLEDEQTTQRILYILAEYKEQVENSPDKDKPAPRRRSNPPTNPGSSKRKKSSSGSRRSGRDVSPIDDSCRTMGSEDSSCGTSQGDCTENCLETNSPQDSPRKVARKLNFEQESNSSPPKPQPQRNVIVADGQTITVARGTAGKPATAVLMPANYILPVSMVKGGQQIAIVTNRGPKLLTVGGGEGGATNTLLLQRLIGPAGLKPVLARPGVRHVRLPTAALHNLQAFNLATATSIQPPDSTASPSTESTPPDLIDTRAEHSPWADRESEGLKPERASSPDDSEPWNLPSSADTHDYTYEETVRAEHMDRTVLDPIQDRYSPDMEAQRIFDKMFDVDTKKSYIVDSPRCGYDIDASDCDDKPYQVVQKKDSSQRQARLAHVSAAALRHKYAILEHELRLQKSLSEECEDLGVDSPSASELFPEAELLFATSPAQDHGPDTPHTPQSVMHNQSGIHPDMDDQIATDQLLPRHNVNIEERQEMDVSGLEDVGIVTVSEDGLQATIALDQEEFARSHPNTTFHSEPTDEGEVQPFTISGLKTRHITSTIFHANRAPATVLMTAPQTTVISQATVDGSSANPVKYSDIDNMINSIPGPHANTINLSSVLVKDEGLTRFDSILTDSRELHLSNTASAIVHSTGSATQVIRRVCYEDDNKRERDRLFLDEPDALIAGEDAKMLAEDSRDATMESMVDVDDDNSSPERHAELFWESNSASERSESRRPMDFSSDSEKCCKSPSYDETNSTDSSGVGTHMRLDSVIKEARGRDRSGSAESSAEDTHPPLRTYPAKRLYHSLEGEVERSLTGKTRAGERSPDSVEVRRRASLRGVVKRGCHCCNGSPAPPRPKKPRQRKPTMDFTAN